MVSSTSGGEVAMAGEGDLTDYRLYLPYLMLSKFIVLNFYVQIQVSPIIVAIFKGFKFVKAKAYVLSRIIYYR